MRSAALPFPAAAGAPRRTGTVRRLSSALLCLLPLATGCAPLAPVPFELLDTHQQVFHGRFYPADQRIDASIDGKQYSGFYIIASGTAMSQGLWPRRGFPAETVTTFSSNSARATLSSVDGERLSCEFLFDGDRALGECKGADNRNYQLLTRQH